MDDAASDTSGTVAFDASITDLNEDQDISAPSDAKPFDDLLGQLGALGALGSGGGRRGRIVELVEGRNRRRSRQVLEVPDRRRE